MSNLSHIEAAGLLLSEQYEEALICLEKKSVDFKQFFSIFSALALIPNNNNDILTLKRKIDVLEIKARENQKKELADKIAEAIPSSWRTPDQIAGIQKVRETVANNQTKRIDQTSEKIFIGEFTVKEALKNYKEQSTAKPEFDYFLKILTTGLIKRMSPDEAALTLLTLINTIRNDRVNDPVLGALFKTFPQEIQTKIQELWTASNKQTPFPFA